MDTGRLINLAKAMIENIDKVDKGPEKAVDRDPSSGVSAELQQLQQQRDMIIIEIKTIVQKAKFEFLKKHHWMYSPGAEHQFLGPLQRKKNAVIWGVDEWNEKSSCIVEVSMMAVRVVVTPEVFSGQVDPLTAKLRNTRMISYDHVAENVHPVYEVWRDWATNWATPTQTQWLKKQDADRTMWAKKLYDAELRRSESGRKKLAARVKSKKKKTKEEEEEKKKKCTDNIKLP
jgi:hypothetical protein